MTFYWFDLFQVFVIGLLLFISWKLINKHKSKWATIPILGIFIIALLPPVNITKDGYGAIEATNRSIEQKPLPPKVTVESQPSFKERVKEDLEEYEKDRKNESID
tara:strand:- start:1762 stop:2076 length:315 start_codon:yes stop_codon:yes gene_type:complete